MIAIDWGTSSFRAYRLDADGSVVERRGAPLGIMQVEGSRFAETLEAQVGDWLSAGETPVVMSGMIGSRQGWVEAPYASCPAGATEIGAGLREVRWGERRAWIVARPVEPGCGRGPRCHARGRNADPRCAR